MDGISAGLTKIICADEPDVPFWQICERIFAEVIAPSRQSRKSVSYIEHFLVAWDNGCTVVEDTPSNTPQLAYVIATLLSSQYV